MTQTTVASPTIYLAGDLGASASKFFYRVLPNQTVPLWMDSAVANGLSDSARPNLSTGDHPIYLQDNLLGQLSDRSVDIICSGGGSCMIRAQLADYFIALSLDDWLIFWDDM